MKVWSEYKSVDEKRNEMHFHDYVNIRNDQIRNGADPQMVDFAKSMTSEEYRSHLISTYSVALRQQKTASVEPGSIFTHWCMACAEEDWVSEERPYYNVWPIAEDLATSVKLEIPFRSIKLPFKSLLLRFAKGSECHDVRTALIWWEDQLKLILINGRASTGRVIVPFNFTDPDQPVEKWLQMVKFGPRHSIGDSEGHLSLVGEKLLRYVVFIGLVAAGEDMLTPIVLSKDQRKYDESDDPDTRRWLEERAARRLGRGFDFGKMLQQQKDMTPHWRSPHIALFWTGPGRKIPVLKMRKGSIVQRVSMADVPTGYFGPEELSEDTWIDEENQRIPISTSLRFDIFNRDKFTCQICGRSVKEDGVKLHVDHVVPISKGGGSDESNLQTTCQDCNLGKSDKLM